MLTAPFPQILRSSCSASTNHRSFSFHSPFSVTSYFRKQSHTHPQFLFCLWGQLSTPFEHPSNGVPQGDSEWGKMGASDELLGASIAHRVVPPPKPTISSRNFLYLFCVSNERRRRRRSRWIYGGGKSKPGMADCNYVYVFSTLIDRKLLCGGRFCVKQNSKRQTKYYR